MKDFSIPSSLAHPITLDKKYRVENEMPRDTRDYVPCRDCGAKAVCDITENTVKGVTFKSQITRCCGKPACKPYREDNPGSETMHKLSDGVVFAYSRLLKDDKERAAKQCGLTFKYLGYAMRKSNNRLLLQKTICDRVEATVMKVYNECVTNLKYKDLDMSITAEAQEIKAAILDKVKNVKFKEENVVCVHTLHLLSSEEVEYIRAGLELLNDRYKDMPNTPDAVGVRALRKRYKREAANK